MSRLYYIYLKYAAHKYKRSIPKKIKHILKKAITYDYLAIRLSIANRLAGIVSYCDHHTQWQLANIIHHFVCSNCSCRFLNAKQLSAVRLFQNVKYQLAKRTTVSVLSCYVYKD